jgi:hypothetical protein
LTAAFAWNICQCKTISAAMVGPSAVNFANAKTGPTLPPDPFDDGGSLAMTAKTGPTLPPDPFDDGGSLAVTAKTGPTLPPDPFDDGGSLAVTASDAAA